MRFEKNTIKFKLTFGLISRISSSVSVRDKLDSVLDRAGEELSEESSEQRELLEAFLRRVRRHSVPLSGQ